MVFSITYYPYFRRFKVKKILVATTALVAFATSAVAADLSPRMYTKAAPAIVSPATNWSGFYLGAFGGYGWNSSNGADLKGGFGGGTLGYNVQNGNFVYGLEGEIAGAGIQQNGVKVDTFGSVAARLGFTVDKALVYGKVGYGWANTKLLNDSKVLGGVTAGAGVEYAFAPNWSVKGEYLWTRLDGKDIGGVSVASSDLQTVKVGVNYHFGR